MVRRDRVKTVFPVGDAPGWSCHRCSQGVLLLDQKSISLRETAESAEAFDHPDWEPNWVRRRFVGLFVCGHCKEPVAVAGDVVVEVNPDPFPTDADEEYIDLLYPSFVNPAPPIFSVSPRVPKRISETIDRAFYLFWSDHSGCANAIRTVIEEVLTERGIRRFTITRSRRRQPLALHSRIEKFRANDAALADAMLAVKWIGNAGSHAGGTLTKDDLFDGFELLEHVLAEIYDRRTKSVAALAKKIISTKRPLSMRRTRSGPDPIT